MSLVARYRFDDVNAMLVDSSGNSNTLAEAPDAYANQARTIEDSTYGTVGNFQASIYYFNANAPPCTIGASARTFSYWSTKLTKYKRNVYGQGTGNDEFRFINNDNGEYQSNLVRNGTTTTITNPTALKVWFFTAYTYDGTEEKLYIDGSLVHTETIALTTGGGEYRIGSSMVATTQRFQGRMTDFRIFDGALPATDVTDMYNNGPNPIIADWVLDVDGRYEVSTKAHLIQIMNEGAAYLNSGTTPTNWSSSSYIQTADIDMLGDSTDVRSMGFSSNWTGVYDGNGFTVSNWVNEESNYPSASTDGKFGFFGQIVGGTVKNFTLAGTCWISGYAGGCGLVADSVTGASTLTNINVNTTAGSFISQSTSETGAVYLGTVIGNLESTGTTMGITFRGEIDNMEYNTTATDVFVGGVVGRILNSSGTNTLFRNLGTFSAGLTGKRVGGIVGQASNSNLTKALNAMKGNIFTETAVGSYVGGIAGQVDTNLDCNEYINSMTGTITMTTTGNYAGGIIGSFEQASGSTVHSFMNYMRGDIEGTGTGGLVGIGNFDVDIATSIVAMDGSVVNPVIGSPSSGATVATVDTSFGLEFTTDSAYNTASPVTGLSTDAESSLPLVDLSALDPDGTLLTFEFILGNGPRSFYQVKLEQVGDNLYFQELEVYDITGNNIAPLGTATALGEGRPATNGNNGDNSSADTVTLIEVNGGSVWTLDFDRPYVINEISKIIFYNDEGRSTAGAGVTLTLYSTDGAPPLEVAVLTTDRVQEFVITALPFLVTPRATSALFTIEAIDGATAYRLTSQESGSNREIVAVPSFTGLKKSINNLVPSTTYTVRLYYTTGSGYTLVGEDTVTTLENFVSNYDKSDFLEDTGRFDFTSLSTTSSQLISDVMNDLFATGDNIDLTVKGKTKTSKFVNRGGTVDISDSEALIAPFSTDGGVGQSISLTLSDSSTVTVSYDNTTDGVTVGSSTYDTGDSFVLDGQKVTIVDL